jgi:hypothetical protein
MTIKFSKSFSSYLRNIILKDIDLNDTDVSTFSRKELIVLAITSFNAEYIEILKLSEFNTLFNDALLLKNFINSSFENKYSFNSYFLLENEYLKNTSFNFKIHLNNTLKHQLLIRKTIDYNSDDIIEIKRLYTYFYQEKSMFKLVSDLHKSLKKKPENLPTLNHFISELLNNYTSNEIKDNLSIIKTLEKDIVNKLKLYTKLDTNLNSKKNIKKVKI